MRLLMVIAMASIVSTAAGASAGNSSFIDDKYRDGLEKIESVELPGWNLHFGICQYPRLNELQVAKKKVISLQKEIEEHEKSIAAKRAEIKQIIESSREHREESYFLLGLVARKTCVKDHQLILDEKSLMWGLIKWGKR